MQGQQPQFNYKKELVLLAESILACNEQEMSACIDRLGEHIARLELTVKKQHKQLQQYKHDNEELRHMCKVHFDNAQKVLRHELRLEEKVLTTKGTVHGTGETFYSEKK